MMVETVWMNGKLRLIVTPQCNLKCFYCHNEGQPKGFGFMNPEWVRRLARWAQESGDCPSAIAISGGEPLLHPQLLEIVRVAASLSNQVTLVTNGTLLCSEKIQELRGAGLSSIRLGIDILDDRKPRPSPGTLKEPFEFERMIDESMDAGLDVQINSVVTRMNESRFTELVDLAVGKGLSSIKLFEVVKVLAFGGQDRPGHVINRSHSDVAVFERALVQAFPGAISVPDARFGDANSVFQVSGTEVRYCRYLCQYGLCWLTGTRVDSSGFAYSCMKARGSIKVLPTHFGRLGRVGQQCDARVGASS